MNTKKLVYLQRDEFLDFVIVLYLFELDIHEQSLTITKFYMNF